MHGSIYFFPCVFFEIRANLFLDFTKKKILVKSSQILHMITFFGKSRKIITKKIQKIFFESFKELLRILNLTVFYIIKRMEIKTYLLNHSKYGLRFIHKRCHEISNKNFVKIFSRLLEDFLSNSFEEGF